MSAPVIAVLPTSTRVPGAVATASLAVGFRDGGLTPSVVALREDPLVGELSGLPVDAVAGAGRVPAVVQAAAVAAVTRRQGAGIVLLHAPVGLLEPLDASGATLRDLLEALAALGVRVGAVVATAADHDALGHCALATEALRTRGLEVLGIVVVGHEGPWPDAARLDDAAGAPLLGTTPVDAHTWDSDEFTARAGAWLPLE